MATEHVPAALVTSPSETIQTDPFNFLRTARIDSTNLRPSAALSSTSSEVHETSSLQPLRSNSDRLGQPIQSSTRLPPDPNSERRETKTNDDEKFPDDHNAIDWIVPKDTKVCNIFISDLNHAEIIKQAGWRTHSRRTSATYPRPCYHREGQIFCKGQVDGMDLKHCHRVASPVRLFNDRPICPFSLRREIGEQLFFFERLLQSI